MLMFQEASLSLWTNPVKHMTKINIIFLIRACGSIEPCIFVAYFLTIFSTSVSNVDPTFERHIFLHNIESIRIIRRKKIWWFIRVGQITNRTFRGNIDGIWERISGTSGYFMWVGSIINVDGRYMQIWATKISFKGIIEAVLKCPVVVLQSWNFLVHVSLCNTLTV